MTYSPEVKVSFSTQGNWFVKLFKSNAQVRKTTERHDFTCQQICLSGYHFHTIDSKMSHAQNMQPMNLTVFKSIPKNPTNFHPQSA